MIFSKLIKRRVASDGVPQLSQLEKVVVDNRRNVLLLLLFLGIKNNKDNIIIPISTSIISEPQKTMENMLG